MKLHCNKCNKDLTKDLYPVKKLNEYTETSEEIDEEGFPDWTNNVIELFAGTYLATKKYTRVFDYVSEEGFTWIGHHLRSYKYPATFSVSKADTLDAPKFKEGWGCCDYHDTNLVCSCGSVVGIMNYDCWIDFKRTDFYQKRPFNSSLP